MPTNKPITVGCRYFNWRLRQRPNGIWQADARGNNKLKGRRHSLGTRELDEAKTFVHLLDEQMAAEQGLLSQQTILDRSEFNLTIDAGFNEYQMHIERPRAAGGPKAGTRKRYERIMRAFRKFLDVKRIQYCEQITRSVLNEYATYRSDACKDSSVKLELLQVRTFLNFLREERLLSPDTHFKFRTKKPKKSKRRYCPLREEVRAILHVAKGKPRSLWLYRAVMMFCQTGLRLGEIAQLTSHDVNLDLNVIFVLDEEEDDESDKETKTGESRFIPITSELRPILEELVNVDNRRLFSGPRGGKLRSDTFNEHLRLEVLVPLKERFPHAKFQSITAHCLRHFFKTYCTYCDISEAEIEAWMGHSTGSMSRRYFHEDIELANESIRKFKPLLADNNKPNQEVEKRNTENFSDEKGQPSVAAASNFIPEVAT